MQFEFERMELIYLYIERFGDYIYQQGLALSNNFEVNIQNKKLIVRKKGNYLKNFYGEKISNISVLVGKNGSGKTTILDILGMTRNERLQSNEFRKRAEDKYFMLYYLGKIEGEELFGFEVTSDCVLQNMIENYKHENDDERYDRSKRSIGKVYKYENDTFISVGKHFFDFKINHDALSSLIRYVYIDEEYRYSFRNNGYGLGYSQDTYIATRKKIPYPNVYQKYLVLLDCINKKIDAVECDKAIVCFKDDIDYKYELNKDNLKKYGDLLFKIESNLCIHSGLHVITSFPKNYSKKDIYILDLYSRYIMEMIAIPLLASCNNGEKLLANIDFDDKQLIEYAKKVEACDSSEEEFGRAVDYKRELELVLKLSGKLLNIYKSDQKNYLKILMRFINSRLHAKFNCKQYKYVEAFEKIVDSLESISEECFVGDCVKINIDDRNNLYTKKLLKEYSYYRDLEYNGEFSTNMESKFEIFFQMLSEGEERFVDIIAKIKESIDEEYGDEKLLVILMDEPDQSLHPEWSRCFVDIITRAIESISFKGNVQVVMSTHSPYLLSDILPSGVFMLNRNLEKRNLSIINAEKNKFSGLGANIYNLMQNEFFMNNTVGEFSTKKINEYIKRINEIDGDTENEFQEIEYFISQIGEPIIKKMMQKKLSEKKYRFMLKENEKRLLELINNEADREKVKEYLRTIGD